MTLPVSPLSDFMLKTTLQHVLSGSKETNVMLLDHVLTPLSERYRTACRVHLEVLEVATERARQRPSQKLEALDRQMKLHPQMSWTRAEDLLRLDAEYDAFKTRCEDDALAVKRCEYQVEALRLEALLVAGALSR